jgi:hypothetical protein
MCPTKKKILWSIILLLVGGAFAINVVIGGLFLGSVLLAVIIYCLLRFIYWLAD